MTKTEHGRTEHMRWIEVAKAVAKSFIVGLDEFGKILSEEPKPQQEKIITKTEMVPTCMDAAGVPTRFIRKCSICGETGRNARTHQEEMRDGTYHWVPRKAN